MNEQKEIIYPDGKVIPLNQNTDDSSRAAQRKEEDDNYVPVIIKRVDEATTHPGDILERAIHEGLEQHKRTGLSLFVSSIAAGLILGFAAMCVAIVYQLYPSNQGVLASRLAISFVYPLGFVICIMSGTQLFTEQTATALYPVLDGKSTLKKLSRLWLIVILGNLLGTLICSFLLSKASTIVAANEGVIEVAKHLNSYSFGEVFISAILAGWLMAQGGWLVLSTPSSTSQVICIYIVTFVIGLGGLHHSIAGSAELFSALFQSDSISLQKSLMTLIAAIFGNLVGGSVFVGILNYAHIKKMT